MSHAERKELEEGASTDAILQKAAASTGRKSEPIALGGESATYRETKASQRMFAKWSNDAPHIAVGTVHVATELAEVAEHGILRLAPRAAPVLAAASAAAPIAGAAVAFKIAKSLPDAWVRGDEQALALNRDARLLGLVLSVKGLPPTYVQGEIAKRPDVTGKDGSPANAIAFQVWCDKGAVTVLQLRVDEGMKTATQCVDAHLAPDAFFKTRPDLGKRYEVDAAFRIGFDALIHAQAQGGATLETTLTELRKRDARCGSTANQVFSG